MSNATATDDRSKPITIGAVVKVLYIDRSRGAELWMDRGTVVGFARTRVLVQFPSRTAPQSVGAECLRVLPMTTTPTTKKEAIMSTTSTKKAPAKKVAPVKKAPAKKAAAPVAKKAPAKKAPAKKVAPVITEVSANHVAIERITALRAEGKSWRVLSAILNAEGITTIRGKQWSANGTTAFLLAGKNGIK